MAKNKKLSPQNIAKLTCLILINNLLEKMVLNNKEVNFGWGDLYWQGKNFKGRNGFILPNSGLLYVYSDYSSGTDKPIKVIYDINNPPVT